MRHDCSSHEAMRRSLKQLYDMTLVWTLSPNPETREHGAEISDDIRRIFDQAN